MPHATARRLRTADRDDGGVLKRTREGPRMGYANGTDHHTWSIILAGGEGTRLTPLIQRWLGIPKPKQYCAFVGTRSMFQHTLDRAECITHPDRTVTVIGKTHGEYALAQLGYRSSGGVLLQPANRDTAAGIYLPLTYIRARDPQATVVIFPSDHFIFPESRFIHAVQQAMQSLHRLPNHLVLLGIPPDSLELQYGWIQPAGLLCQINGCRVRGISEFLEKPSLKQAASARAAGALWNTFVVIAQAETLWQIGWQTVPTIMTLFEQLTESIGTTKEGAMLDAIYQIMPKQNFSTDVLQHVADRIAVIKVSQVLWSDWGHPNRVLATLRHIGKRPMFPPELVEVYSA